MGALNVTYAFDKDVDLLSGYSRTLRSEYVFGFPGDGLGWSRHANDEAYKALCVGAFFLGLCVKGICRYSRCIWT